MIMKRFGSAWALTILMLTSVLLVGCLGGDDEGSGPVTIDEDGTVALDDWQVHYAATSGDLPECGSETIGRLYFVSDDQEFQACIPGGWQPIDISGPPGPAGPAGEGAVVEEGCINIFS